MLALHAIEAIGLDGWSLAAWLTGVAGMCLHAIAPPPDAAIQAALIHAGAL